MGNKPAELAPPSTDAQSTFVRSAEFSVNSPLNMMVLVKSIESPSSPCMVHFIEVTKLVLSMKIIG